jgi:hypothetical protein
VATHVCTCSTRMHTVQSTYMYHVYCATTCMCTVHVYVHSTLYFLINYIYSHFLLVICLLLYMFYIILLSFIMFIILLCLLLSSVYIILIIYHSHKLLHYIIKKIWFKPSVGNHIFSPHKLKRCDINYYVFNSHSQFTNIILTRT